MDKLNFTTRQQTPSFAIKETICFVVLFRVYPFTMTVSGMIEGVVQNALFVCAVERVKGTTIK